MSSQDMQLKVTLSGDGRQLSGTLKTATGEVQQFGTNTATASATAAQSFQSVEQHSQRLSSSIGELKGVVGALAGALAALGAAQQFNAIVRETEQLERNLLRTEQLIESTGRAASASANELHQQARELALATLGSTEGIMEAQQILMTFRNVSVSSFAEVTERALDLAAVTGGGLSGSMTQLAKALQDPVEGINAMTRSGVSFSQHQKDVIQSLVETGDVAAAQRVILDELAGQYGGVARREALGLAGAQDTLGQALQEARIAIGAQSGVTERMASLYNSAAESVFDFTRQLESGEFEAHLAVMQATGGAVVGAATAYSAYSAALGMATLAKKSATLAQTALNAALRANPIGIVVTSLAALGGALFAARNHTMELGDATATVGDYISAVWNEVSGAASVAAAIAMSYWYEFVSGVSDVIDWISGAFGSAFEFIANAAKRSINNTIAIFATVGDVAAIIGRNIMGAFSGAFDSVLNIGRGFWESLQAIFDGDFSFSAFRNSLRSQLVNPMIGAAQEIGEAFERNFSRDYLGAGFEAASHVVSGFTGRVIESASASYQARQTTQELTTTIRDQSTAFEDASAAVTGVDAEYQRWLNNVLNSLDPLRELEQQMEMVWRAHAAGDLDDVQVQTFIDQWINGFKRIEDADPFNNLGRSVQDFTEATLDSLRTMQGAFQIGSQGYAALDVAIQAVNATQAVNAVLNQAAGDPYTAFARMATMAAAVAALGYSVGNLGGGFTDDAARRQAEQGTGTVLGDAAAKTESILSAVETTANATRELVGINRSMLNALQNLQGSIAGTSTQVMRRSRGLEFDYGFGAGQGVGALVNDNPLSGFSGLIENTLFDKLSFGLFSGIFNSVGKMLGGSSKVTDEGIRIIGGTLAELMEEVTVEAYQQTRYRRTRVSRSRSRTSYQELDGGLGDQFSQIFTSIADSVHSGAEALGMAGADVEAAIRAFEIETQKISLKGLSPEEQQAEFEAVFGVIFDDLAGHVVDWLPEFQKAGEGLGETLARVATSVQVTEEAMFRLGFAAERISAEDFADLSVYLMEAAGGMEQFISSMSSFVDKFAPESHKLDLLSADMERALSDVGLAVPATRDEMWQLMQTLDATTEAGADQIATLLRLSDTADAYYTMLEQSGMRLQALLGAQQSDALTDYLGQVADWSARELSRIEQDYRERIALAEQQLRIGRELRQYVEQLRISELSPYDPGEKLELATERFAELMVRAEQGDMEAARQLQQAAQDYLQNADAYYGRSDPYLSIFEEVTRSLDRLGLDIIGGLDDNTIERLNQQMLAEQQRIRDYTQQELQWAVRQYDALTSIEQLLELLPGSLADQLQGIINKPSSDAAVTPDRDGFLLAQIEQMYTHHLGRDADVEGAQYWVNLARDQGLDAVDWNIRNSEEYKKIHGSHKTGLQRVPFDGYVAELHKDERVLTEKEAAEYNSFDSVAIVSELAALRQEVAQLRAERKSDAATAEQQRDRQLRAARKTPELI